MRVASETWSSCACVCAARRVRARRCRRGRCRRRRERRHGQVRGGRRGVVLRRDGGARHAPGGDHGSLAAERSARAAGAAAPRPDRRSGASRGPRRRLRDVPVSTARDRERARATRGVRRLAGRARPRVPRGAAVRRRERAEPGRVLAAAVHALRPSAPPTPSGRSSRRATTRSRRSIRTSPSSASGSRRAATTGPSPGATSRPRRCASSPRSVAGTGRAAATGR